MAKTVEQIMQEQMGGMLMQLCIKDARLQQLEEENAVLKKSLAALEPKKKEEKQ